MTSKFSIALVFPVLIAGAVAGQSTLWRVPTPQATGVRDVLEQAGWDVAGADRVHQHVDVVGDSAVPAALAALGLAAIPQWSATPFASRAPTLGLPTDIPAGYRTPASLDAAAAALAAAYPNLCVLRNLNNDYGLPPTVEGRSIKALKISDNPTIDEDEPAVLLVALHHARELNTAEVAMDHAARLASLYATDTNVRNWVDNHEIWVAWSFNPDGHEYCWTTNALWRKNRRLISGTTYGVDLNRNYALGWSSTCGGSTTPSNETYRGSAAMGERETQVMQAFANHRRFAKLIDFHSYGRDVLYTYRCTAFPAMLETWYQSEAVSLALACGWTAADIRKSSAEGEHFQWEIWRHGTHAFLVELGTAFQPAYTEVVTESQSTWGGVQWILSRPIPVSGHVRDACTGQPLSADISVAGIAYSAGEIRESSPTTGRYHLFVPPGTWSVTYSKAGYQSVTRTLSVGAGVGMVEDIALDPIVALNAPAVLPVGATSTFSMSAPTSPNTFYAILAGASGTAPGFDVGSCHLSINPDAVTSLFLDTSPLFGGFTGMTDAAGAAASFLTIPSDPALVGIQLHFLPATLAAPSPVAVRAAPIASPSVIGP